MDHFKGHGFPVGEYTPYGYLHTPKHTFLHPSGVLRTVAPLGMGWFRSGLPWYGFSRLTHYNSYLMLLVPSVSVNGKLFAEEEDFRAEGVKLVSAYHSSEILTYNFSRDGLETEFRYFSGGEDSLYLQAVFTNQGEADAKLRFDCTLVYGMTGSRWWGSDAAMAKARSHGIVSKILACGDVAVLRSAPDPEEAFAVRGLEELAAFRNGKAFNDRNVSVPLPDPVCGGLNFIRTVAPGQSETICCVLARGKSENPVWALAEEKLQRAEAVFTEKLASDDAFYRDMPQLEGDFPEEWKRGLVYDFETLRMNIADPAGIYKHRWDTMQALAPRVVLAETSIDMMTMQYASPETAKEILEGIFADAPDPFVPCTREDGSMNMIGMDGTECATAPLWGSPMFVIRQVFANTGDKTWLSAMYPMLCRWLDWFRENRTDTDGWYHCNNSWESGQDGSVRFTAGMTGENGPVEAANAEFVRTADLEAAMAYAEYTMAEFADILNRPEEETIRWRDRAERGKERVRSMFVDGYFRDFDNRNGKPFLNMGYYDPMLSMPFAMGLAAEEQKTAAEKAFRCFRENQQDLSVSTGHALVWPPLLMTYTEACVNSGRQMQGAEAVAVYADSAYGRSDARRTAQMNRTMEGVPEKWNVIIPGTAMETLASDLAGAGCENYGWGALLPALIFRIIFGIRVDPDGSVHIRPALPDNLKGNTFRVKNLCLRGKKMTFRADRVPGGKTGVTVMFADGKKLTKVLDPEETLDFSLE